MTAVSATDAGQPSLISANLSSILQRVAVAAFAFAAGRGWIPVDQQVPLATAAVTLFTVVWALYKNFSAHKALRAAIAAPAGKVAP